jgi:hypothetical protein
MGASKVDVGQGVGAAHARAFDVGSRLKHGLRGALKLFPPPQLRFLSWGWPRPTPLLFGLATYSPYRMRAGTFQTESSPEGLRHTAFAHAPT